MVDSADATAQARLRSHRALHGPSTRVGRIVGGGVLAFGPTAVVDAINSASWSGDGSFSFDWHGFAVRSTRSQTGNVAGILGGAVLALAIFGTGAIGWPVVLVTLGGGILAQALWDWSGYDDGAAKYVDSVLL